MIEDHELVMMALRHVRDNYAEVLDNWQYEAEIIRIRLAQLNGRNS